MDSSRVATHTSTRVGITLESGPAESAGIDDGFDNHPRRQEIAP